MSNSKRSGPLSSTSDVLQSLLTNGKSPLSQGFTRWQLWQNWRSVVGETLAQHSCPVGYKNGLLYVWVDSSVRMQEMMFLVTDIRDKVNAYVGRKWVSRIQFTLNKADIPDEKDVEKSFTDFLKKHAKR